MVSIIIVGVNSYVTQAEADTYLGDSVRGTPWATINGSSKDRALITAFRLLEKQRWKSIKTGVRIVDTVVVNAGGSGYSTNEILTVVGGTFGEAARIKVTAVSAGVVTTVQAVDVGTYTVEPTSPVSTTVLPAGGTGCTLDLTFKDQVLEHPRVGLEDINENLIPDAQVASGIENGQIELAFELSQDSDLETEASVGNNNRSLRAGSAAIEFFRPTIGTGDDTRFPTVVQEHIRPFLEGGDMTIPLASGTDVESQFDDTDKLKLSEGLY